jgi:hypothetical protein
MLNGRNHGNEIYSQSREDSCDTKNVETIFFQSQFYLQAVVIQQIGRKETMACRGVLSGTPL